MTDTYAKGLEDRRDAEYLAAPDPERIWLGPRCEGLDQDGRTWSTDSHDCDDFGCGLKSVEYIRADLVATLKR